MHDRDYVQGMYEVFAEMRRGAVTRAEPSGTRATGSRSTRTSRRPWWPPREAAAVCPERAIELDA